MKTYFDQLAPFIQAYIYRQRWETLHQVQEAACELIFNTDHHVLLLTPTASGKTEAAFLPIITQLYNQPVNTVGVLYIAPLKALINDQFHRLEGLLETSDIRLTKWHGDASQIEKEKLMKAPNGILQITPESLEAMLMRRRRLLPELFGELKFIVIDEMHHFMGDDRGIQLTALLERLCELAGVSPRRVGLSATLSNIPTAQRWLALGTDRQVTVPSLSVEKRRARVWIDYFTNTPAYYEHLYALSRGHKSIIFANRRSEVEQNIHQLKALAQRHNEPDIFHVHHGSISKSNRTHTEKEMKEATGPIATGATVTLELGIDLGNLDRVIQTGSPHTVSSLAQRLGRSGRRKHEVSEMWFIFCEPPVEKKPQAFYKQMNWELIKCIALIELYRQQWVEPLTVDPLPYHILAHQTLSVLYSEGVLSPAQLASRLLSLETFEHITTDDYRLLLKHMIHKDLLEQTQDKQLMFGKKGEQIIGGFDFYTVFENPVEYMVKEGNRDIGLLYQLLPVGERFLLSGKVWQVIAVDLKGMNLHVKPVSGEAGVSFEGRGYEATHTKVRQMMREVLLGAEGYGYLGQAGADQLQQNRSMWQVHMGETGGGMNLVQIAPNVVGIFHWLGNQALQGLILGLQLQGMPLAQMDNPQSEVVVFVTAKGVKEVEAGLKHLENVPLTLEAVSELEIEVPSGGKYGAFVPEALRRKQFLVGLFEGY